MGELEIPILCYNFMAGTDWARTTLDAPERGGARVTAFDLNDVEKVRVLGHDASTDYDGPEVDSIDRKTLWDNLERLLSAAGQKVPGGKPILEVNPDHVVVQHVARHRESDSVQDWAGILFDQALLSEGGRLDDPAGFVRRMNDMILSVTEERDAAG